MLLFRFFFISMVMELYLTLKIENKYFHIYNYIFDVLIFLVIVEVICSMFTEYYINWCFCTRREGLGHLVILDHQEMNSLSIMLYFKFL